MKKIEGIKSVDMLIEATGEGIVNHNGSFKVYNPAAGQAVENHMFPKLRGLDPMQKIILDSDGKRGSFRLDNPELAKASLIVSSECLRSHLFKSDSFGISQVTMANIENVLASIHGLVRGFLNTDNNRNFARKSPLYMTDFECMNPGLYFDQHTNSKARGTDQEATSIYSYFGTAGNLKYTGKASISIEDLQFIALENSLGRTSYDHTVSVSKAIQIADKISEFLQALAPVNLKPKANFIKKAVRIGSVSGVGDAGVLLNNDAIHVLVMAILERMESLSFRQSKGWLGVQSLTIDFNPTSRAFRSQNNPLIANDLSGSVPTYACFYEEADYSDSEFESDQKNKAEALSKKEKKNKK